MSTVRTSNVLPSVLGILQVATFAVLKAFRIYPSEIFEKRRCFGCLVWWSRSALLSDYVVDAVSSLEEVMRKCLLSHFYICLSKDRELKFRFIFEFEVKRLAARDLLDFKCEEFLVSLENLLSQIECLPILHGPLEEVSEFHFSYRPVDDDDHLTGKAIGLRQISDQDEARRRALSVLRMHWVPEVADKISGPDLEIRCVLKRFLCPQIKNKLRMTARG
eukprot:GHVP01066271.1.p2 GENE.GHVP01066271.1~~GHVP01066271.1.p2  ORF type:complete len:219 (-),score=30.60 GHVP01066271.1:184-840(-)